MEVSLIAFALVIFLVLLRVPIGIAMGFIGAVGFNVAACQAMIRHSRFSPASDEAGEAAWGAYSTRLTYRISQ